MVTRREAFDQLLELAERLFDKVEHITGDFRGGVCRVRDERRLILNRNQPLDTKLKVLASALAEEPLDTLYILPSLREAIETYGESQFGDARSE